MGLFDNGRRQLFHLTDDWVFYAVYGAGTEESNRALIAILNMILDRGEDPIVSIRILNPVMKGRRIRRKGSVLDIKAETGAGEIIDIEMQNGGLAVYRNRSVFHGGKLITSSLEKGQNYDKMKKSIVISIINSRLFSETEKMHSIFRLKEIDDGFVLSDRIEHHFLELGNLPQISSMEDLERLEPLERFAFYLKYAGVREMEDYLCALIEFDEEAVRMSERVFHELTEDDIAYEMLEREEKFEHDLAGWIDAAERRGLAEARLSIARAMKAEGYPIEEICKLTHMPEEEVEEL
ncbi:PD-(D/E)XK nuclease family transposase [uncultured Eubacterium sp.]|nr:PD-(D/E)XK nuclease family transposase [uncultured Eubacterium sp.]